MTDKTQEELEKFLDTVKIHNKDLDVCINDAVAKKWLTHYINKYYVPKGDLEDQVVSNEVGGNQADKLSEDTPSRQELPQEIDRIVEKLVPCHNNTMPESYYCKDCKSLIEEAKLSLQALIDKRVALEVTKIRSLFNMSEFNHIGTMKDKHMLTRAPEEVEESKRYNRDHSWANMYAQGKIDKYIKGNDLLGSNPETTTKANSNAKSESIRREKR